MMNRLYEMRCYECGAMDRTKDGGVGWRKIVQDELEKMGVVVFNPTDKPIDIGIEDHEMRDKINDAKQREDFDFVVDQRIIRNVDLRMVDLADFLFVHLDMDAKPCGTFEEIGLANRQKKPVIIWGEGGKKNIPTWLFWELRHEMFFDTMEDALDYLHRVNSGEATEHYNRWMFFDLKNPLRRKLENTIIDMWLPNVTSQTIDSISTASDDELLEMYQKWAIYHESNRT